MVAKQRSSVKTHLLLEPNIAQIVAYLEKTYGHEAPGIGERYLQVMSSPPAKLSNLGLPTFTPGEPCPDCQSTHTRKHTETTAGNPRLYCHDCKKYITSKADEPRVVIQPKKFKQTSKSRAPKNSWAQQECPHCWSSAVILHSSDYIYCKDCTKYSRRDPSSIKPKIQCPKCSSHNTRLHGQAQMYCKDCTRHSLRDPSKNKPKPKIQCPKCTSFHTQFKGKDLYCQECNGYTRKDRTTLNENDFFPCPVCASVQTLPHGPNKIHCADCQKIRYKDPSKLKPKAQCPKCSGFETKSHGKLNIFCFDCQQFVRRNYTKKLPLRLD